MDTLFIQFYSKILNVNPRFKGIHLYELCNGFSDTYNLCKSKGDFLWVYHNKQNKGFGTNAEEIKQQPLPISKGTIYVCAYYITQLYQVYEWAKRYPDIKFIVGGPSANPNVYNVDENIIPSNMYIINKTVEEYFKVPNFSYNWKLDIPEVDRNMTLAYGYTLRSSCYWGKCIFCNQSQGNRVRRNIDFKFQDIEYDGLQRVNLYTPAMTYNQIVKIIPNLKYNKNIRYDIYLRGNKLESKALDRVFKNRKDLPRIKFIVGVEYPSERMLKYMNKNISIEGVLEVINKIAEYGKDRLQIQLPFILGWNNLDERDIENLEIFLDKILYNKCNISFSVNLLAARLHTVVHETYKVGKPLNIGPFNVGFQPLISAEQRKLTVKSLKILRSKGVTVFNYEPVNRN